jgi:hypothetical protein
MRLPDLVAYQAAVQHPSTAFGDPHLRAASVTTGRLGLPRAVSGNFAVTYQLRTGTRQWAVRCFHREAADRASRYAAISQALARLRDGPLVPIDYFDTGIRVGQAWYPITKMAWIDGHPLNQAVEARLEQPSALRDIERRFVQVAADLRQRGIAHGDLQHGNILVDRSGALRLVDYDGMFVPALRGRAASESGDPNYQHPRRGAEFDLELDRFAVLVIVVALRALAEAPRLWRTYNTGDNLLFRRTDFVDPSHSALFGELSGVAGIAELSKRLAGVCHDEYTRVPLLDDFLGSGTRGSAPLKPGHVAVLNRLYGPRPPRAAALVKPRSWKLRRAIVQQAAAFSSDGAQFATADRDGKICLRDSGTGQTKRTLRLPRAAGILRGLAFTDDGRLLAAATDGPALSVCDVAGPKRVQALNTTGRRAMAVALSADGGWLAAAGDDGELRCWRVADGRLVARLAPAGPVNALAISRDGRYVAATDRRGPVRVWQLPGARLAGSLAVGRGTTCLTFGRDGAHLTVGHSGGTVQVWNIRDRTLVHELSLGPLESVALCADALGATGSDGAVWVRRLPLLRQGVEREQTAGVRVISYRVLDWLRRVALL